MDKLSLTALGVSMGFALLSHFFLLLTQKSVEAKAAITTGISELQKGDFNSYYCYMELPDGETRDLAHLCNTAPSYYDEESSGRGADTDTEGIMDLEIYTGGDISAAERLRDEIRQEDGIIELPNGVRIDVSGLESGDEPKVYTAGGELLRPGEQISGEWQRLEPDQIGDAVSDYEPFSQRIE